MTPLTILDNISIASPCEADWAQMAGDDRTRFCASCSKHVYNIASMTAEEATELILGREGRLCVQIYRRRDGTVLTADCPVGGRIFKARRLRRVLALGMVLPALAVAGIAASGFGKRRVEPFPSGPVVTWNDQLDWALVTLGLRKPFSRSVKGTIDFRIKYVQCLPSSGTQAKLQREKMRQAGIPLPGEGNSPSSR